MSNKLDLSKLKPVELPEQEIEVQIKGDTNKQNISVHAISGEGILAWANNAKNNPESVEYEARACVTALVYGADIPEDKAKMLVNFDRETAQKISMAVWLLTSEYYSAQKQESETAEKNSEAAEVNTDA